MEYLIILLALFLLTLFLEYKFRIHLYSSRKERIVITTVFFVIGVAWDSFAVARGHWQFPIGGGSGLTGIKIGILPLEEYLFILVLPFWIITTYKLIHEKIKYR